MVNKGKRTQHYAGFIEEWANMSTFFVKQADLDPDNGITPIVVCRPNELDDIFETLSARELGVCQTRDFKAKAGQTVVIMGSKGEVAKVIFGAGEPGYAGSELNLGKLPRALPAGVYQLQTLPQDWDQHLASVCWGMGAYQFGRYLKEINPVATLLLDDDEEAGEIIATVDAVSLGRDLINTPAGDMGPVALQGVAENLAKEFDGEVSATIGDDLLKENLPMIHAVGRAAHEPPRLVQLVWGNPNHPRLALVGKGICFDSGGLDIKSASGMRIMKKDMGGAAHALSLAKMIMAANLPIHLHVWLAVAENAVSANAFRPGDVLTARNGKTVEIDNTDAEGRLVLGDALTKASEQDPALIIDFATLTGAARVALGPTLPPFFTNQKNLVPVINAHTEAQLDPVWNMPLWAPYLSMLSSPIAELKNAGGSFAGCVTAALFLQQFITADERTPPWMHFDVYGWNPTSAPSKPKGGEIFVVRGLYHWLKDGGLDAV